MKKNKRILFLGNLMIAYNRDVLHGVAVYAEDRPELRVFFPDSFEPSDLVNLIHGDVQGVLVAGCPPVWELPAKIAALGLPAVEITAGQPPSSLPRVVPDNAAVGKMAADYFIDRGFQRLIYYGMIQRYWSEERWRGFHEQAAARGVSAQHFLKEQSEAEDRAGLFPDVAAKWLKKIIKPSAIFAGDDLLGAYLIEACRRLNIHVPEDVAILGVDNDPLYGQLRKPHLSSIALNNLEIGRCAMELLDGLMRSRNRPPLAPSTILAPPVQVITRLSSDIFGVEDELVRKALGLIQQRFRGGLSVKWLATQLAVSRTALGRHFKAALHRSPAMEIARVQLETARHLIVDSDMSIAKVAEETGYSSPRQFSTSFHHYFKETPRNMRKANRHAAATVDLGKRPNRRQDVVKIKESPCISCMDGCFIHLCRENGNAAMSPVNR